MTNTPTRPWISNRDLDVLMLTGFLAWCFWSAAFGVVNLVTVLVDLVLALA